jgi:hypothetical protein
LEETTVEIRPLTNKTDHLRKKTTTYEKSPLIGKNDLFFTVFLPQKKNTRLKAWCKQKISNFVPSIFPYSKTATHSAKREATKKSITTGKYAPTDN